MITKLEICLVQFNTLQHQDQIHTCNNPLQHTILAIINNGKTTTTTTTTTSAAEPPALNGQQLTPSQGLNAFLPTESSR